MRSANISVNIFAHISAIKTASIRGAKNTANIYGYIGATLKSPQIFAQIFAVKKAKIYAPQIFAQLFAIILAQRSKYRTYWRKYLRRKKRKYTHRKYLCKYLRKYLRKKKRKIPMAPYSWRTEVITTFSSFALTKKYYYFNPNYPIVVGIENFKFILKLCHYDK